MVFAMALVDIKNIVFIDRYVCWSYFSESPLEYLKCDLDRLHGNKSYIEIGICVCACLCDQRRSASV